MKRRILSAILIFCLVFSLNSMNLFAASNGESQIAPCADETQTKSKTWTVKIVNGSGVERARVTITMKGLYSLADGSRRITEFTYPDTGTYANVITCSVTQYGTYNRTLAIKADGNTILTLNFVFGSNGNMYISTSGYYGLTTITLTHDF